MTLYCENCGQKVTYRAKYCPNCGCDMRNAPYRRTSFKSKTNQSSTLRKAIPMFLVFLMALILVNGAYSIFLHHDNGSADDSANYTDDGDYDDLVAEYNKIVPDTAAESQSSYSTSSQSSSHDS